MMRRRIGKVFFFMVLAIIFASGMVEAMAIQDPVINEDMSEMLQYYLDYIASFGDYVEEDVTYKISTLYICDSFVSYEILIKVELTQAATVVFSDEYSFYIRFNINNADYSKMRNTWIVLPLEIGTNRSQGEKFADSAMAMASLGLLGATVDDLQEANLYLQKWADGYGMNDSYNYINDVGAEVRMRCSNGNINMTVFPRSE